VIPARELDEDDSLSLARCFRWEAIILGDLVGGEGYRGCLFVGGLSCISAVVEGDVIQSQDVFHGISDPCGNVYGSRVGSVDSLVMGIMPQVHVKRFVDRSQGSFQDDVVPDLRNLHDFQPVRAGETPDRCDVAGVRLLKVLELVSRQMGSCMGSRGADPVNLLGSRMVFWER
jgi:hypothetical protein